MHFQSSVKSSGKVIFLPISFRSPWNLWPESHIKWHWTRSKRSEHCRRKNLNCKIGRDGDNKTGGGMKRKLADCFGFSWDSCFIEKTAKNLWLLKKIIESLHFQNGYFSWRNLFNTLSFEFLTKFIKTVWYCKALFYLTVHITWESLLHSFLSYTTKCMKHCSPLMCIGDVS